MNHPPKPTPATDAVRALVYLLNDSDPDRLSPQEKRRQINEAGYDATRLKKRLVDAYTAAQGQAELAVAKQRRLDLSERIRELVGKLPTLPNPRDALRAVFEGVGGSQAAVACRKLEETSDEDLATLLEDVEIVQFMNRDPDAHDQTNPAD